MRAIRFLLLLAALAVSRPAAAQDGHGTSAVAVLQLAPAPRPLALGGAYAALAGELSIFYNPARLSAGAPALGFAYQSLPTDAGAGAAAAALGLGPGMLGIGLQFLDLGEIEVIEPDPASDGETGLPTGERAGGGEVVLSGGYGVRIGEWVQVGAAAKMIHSRLAEAQATGAAFDVGAAADLFGGRLTLAAALQNLGRDFGPGLASPLPRRARAGAAYRWGGETGPGAALAVEAILQEGRTTLATGIEAGIAGPGGTRFVGRAGYQEAPWGDDGRPPVVVGAGLLLGTLALDYAWRPLGPLGAGHLFGFSLHFDR